MAWKVAAIAIMILAVFAPLRIEHVIRREIACIHGIRRQWMWSIASALWLAVPVIVVVSLRGQPWLRTPGGAFRYFIAMAILALVTICCRLLWATFIRDRMKPFILSEMLQRLDNAVADDGGLVETDRYPRP